ncbi:MAG: hypothetical protein PVSMB9_04840 [Candidatus Dormibacteria bacterium]
MPFTGHWPALLLVLVIVLIVWGPGKLPEIGSAVGKAMHEFRKQSTDFQDEIRRSAAVKSEPETYHTAEVPTTPAPMPAPETKPTEPSTGGGPSATPGVQA